MQMASVEDEAYLVKLEECKWYAQYVQELSVLLGIVLLILFLLLFRLSFGDIVVLFALVFISEANRIDFGISLTDSD